MASVYVLHRLRIPEKKKKTELHKERVYMMFSHQQFITSTFQISHKRI